MKIRHILACALLAALALPGRAQGYTIPVSDLESDFGARMSLSVDKKLSKGLHLEAYTEGRMTDNFSNLDRIDAGLGLTYKPGTIFKFGAGYTMIEKKSDAGNWKMRHRAWASASATLKAGDWRFQFKERLQLTHKEVNEIKHQTTPNSLTLKSRFKVSYKGLREWTPYTYLEMRNVFNDPACSVTWSTATETFGDYTFLGYNHAYVNRLRGCIGTEYKLSKSHSLDFYLLTDYCYDKKTDTYSNGTYLRSISYERTLNTAICVGYKFSF